MPELGKVFEQPYGQQVFVSHTHADDSLCKPLREALDAWNVGYWYDSENARIGHRLLDELLHNVRESDILLRVCTPAATHSAWMHRELGMFLAFQRERALSNPQHSARIINVCFAGYEPETIDRDYLYIDAASLPRGGWLDHLRRALELPMGWVKFAGDDDSYLWWIGAYSQGYVINAYWRPRPNELTLHRSTCTFVNNVERYGKGTFTERDYIKICSAERTELARWAREQVSPDAILNDGCYCMR